MSPPSHLDLPSDIPSLMDWKRRIFGLYAAARASDDPQAAWMKWREARDRMFSEHPQSPLAPGKRTAFGGLDYFAYDSGARVTGELRSAEPKHYDIATSGDSSMSFTRCGLVSFELEGKELSLELYWLEGYGGGLFLPFRDETSGAGTYGAGRYLLDTVKGADLGMEKDRLVLDFNFAYNPSCAYDPAWVCPLAPPPNRLDHPVRAGEK